MASYKVKWGYKSSIGGPWMKGDVVQMDEPLAEAINKDSPGVLVAVDKGIDKGDDKGLKPLARKGKGKQPGQDRMIKESENRVKELLENEGVITKSDFKAVKNK